MCGQAQDLGGSWHIANDLNFSQRYLEAVKRATPEEVRRVGREYFSEQNRSMYALLPAGTTPAGCRSQTASTKNVVPGI
jgi:predicted Zn-dependent peptidase